METINIKMKENETVYFLQDPPPLSTEEVGLFRVFALG
jgi:hypothetical protein